MSLCVCVFKQVLSLPASFELQIVLIMATINNQCDGSIDRRRLINTRMDSLVHCDVCSLCELTVNGVSVEVDLWSYCWDYCPLNRGKD